MRIFLTWANKTKMKCSNNFWTYSSYLLTNSLTKSIQSYKFLANKRKSMITLSLICKRRSKYQEMIGADPWWVLRNLNGHINIWGRAKTWQRVNLTREIQVVHHLSPRKRTRTTRVITKQKFISGMCKHTTKRP